LLPFLGLFFLLNLEQPMVLRAHAEHLRAAARASFFLTGHAVAMGNLFTTFRAHTDAACAHFMSALYSHVSIPPFRFRLRPFLR
jgi:hypothetical protein